MATTELAIDMHGGRVTAELAIDVQGGMAGGRVTADVQGGSVTNAHPRPRHERPSHAMSGDTHLSGPI